MITVFKSFSDTDKPTHTNVLQVLDKIRTGGDKKEFIENLRTLDKEEYDKQKKTLPVICFGGEFSSRSKEGLIKSSGLLIGDFDHVKDMDELERRITSKSYCFANFRSPSNDGFKTLFRIPRVKDDKEYKLYFKMLSKDFPELDQSGKDISRACFFTHDPKMYLNKHATEYRLPDKRKLYEVKDWDNVNKALRKIEDAVDGEKHLVRTKIGYLFGGWVAAKALSYDDALSLLEASVAKNTTDFSAAMKTIRECLMAGMSKPLSMHEQRATLDMKVGLGKAYYHVDEVWDKIETFYKEGYKRGFDTGWAALDANYSVLMGTTTIAYGPPASGKSQLFHELYVNLAKNFGLNIVMLSPETGDVEHIYGELMSIYIGKSFVGDYKLNEQEKQSAKEFIRQHFFVIDTFGDDFNYRDVLTQVEAIERSYEIKVHIVSVDPLNYLDNIHPNLRSDIAQSKDLDVFNADARKNNRHNVIITHTRDTEPRRIKDRETGEVLREWLPMPKPRDILNGQSFYRKGMNMVGVWRPIDFDGNPLEGYEQNELVVDIAKVKPKGCATLGKVSLYYDFKSNQFKETPVVYQRQQQPEPSIGSWDKIDPQDDAPF